MISQYSLTQKKQNCQEMNEQYQYQQCNQCNEYEDGLNEYEQDWELEPRPSKDNPYNVYQMKDLITKILNQNHQKCSLTALPQGWNLMLYFFCDFSEQKLCNVIDQEKTGRNMIRYDEQYIPKVSEGECMVCLSQTELVSNVCGHTFCYCCWKMYLQLSHCNRSSYQLFPMCQFQGCFHRTNYLLMQLIWQRFGEMKQHFDRLLCLKYAQMSDKVKICNRERCNKVIFINYITEGAIVCSCGNRLCRHCGQNDHFPLNCGDLQAWRRIYSNKQNLWLNEIITQKCPMCKTPIDKNGGCVHMTCICSYQFCWICLNVWKGHNDFYSCQSTKKEEHELRLLQEQRKRKQNEGEYSQRFQQSKCEIERSQHIIKRLQRIDMKQMIEDLNICHILTNDVVKLNSVRQFVIEFMQLNITSQIYIFFMLDGFWLLKSDLQNMTKKISKLDDYFEEKTKLAEIVHQIREDCRQSNTEMEVSSAKLMKDEFFDMRDYYQEQLRTTKIFYQDIRLGKFMELCKLKK